MAKKVEKPNGLGQLKAAIRDKVPDRLYVFHGEEVFLLQHYLQQLRKLLIDDLTESFNFHKFTQETFDIREFEDAINNLPMMAESTFILVDDIDLFKQNVKFLAAQKLFWPRRLMAKRAIEIADIGDLQIDPIEHTLTSSLDIDAILP